MICDHADRGTTYEFRVSAKNNVDYGERAVDTIRTPDGGKFLEKLLNSLPPEKALCVVSKAVIYRNQHQNSVEM